MPFTSLYWVSFHGFAFAIRNFFFFSMFVLGCLHHRLTCVPLQLDLPPDRVPEWVGRLRKVLLCPRQNSFVACSSMLPSQWGKRKNLKQSFLRKILSLIEKSCLPPPQTRIPDAAAQPGFTSSSSCPFPGLWLDSSCRRISGCFVCLFKQAWRDRA